MTLQSTKHKVMQYRIQKLLLTDYVSFAETILFESPFVQVNSKGDGVRQVQLGLTDMNLIIAEDILIPSSQTYWNGKDPETDTLVLVSIMPLQLISMKIRKGRLKLAIATGRRMYFEFGGHLDRGFFIRIWMDRVEEIRVQRAAIQPPVLSSSSSNLSQKVENFFEEEVENSTETTQTRTGFNLRRYVKKFFSYHSSENNEKSGERENLIQKDENKEYIVDLHEMGDRKIAELFRKVPMRFDSKSFDNTLWFDK